MLNNLMRKMALPSTLLLGMTAATLALADDTELYSVTYSAGDTGKPKVLIIFDDSGSMRTELKGVKPPYNPNATYKSSVTAGRVYWTSSGSTPPPKNSDQWFPAASNGCGESLTPLAEQGTFNANNAARWQQKNGNWVTSRVCVTWFFFCLKYEDQTTWSGDPAGWLDLTPGINGGTKLLTVDCSNDVYPQAPNDTNASPFASGAYPQKAVAQDAANSAAYLTGVLPTGNSALNWPAGARRFYTSHYMDWYYDNSIIPETKTYLQTAKDVLTDLVKTNTSIDFGLAVFNNNTSKDNNGGRIVKRIVKNMTSTDRTGMITTINNFTASGNTPLCETAWEGFLYLTGGKRLYATPSAAESPARDTTAESGGKYISPLEQCANTYIIYMTDGEPTQDGAADTLVTNLTGESCRTYGTSNNDGNVQFTSCLAPLSEYMAEHDLDGNAANSSQVAPMATVGFNVGPEATALLTDAATMTKKDGTAGYYDARSAEDLTNAFNDVLLGILSTESTFTSPAVAVDSFSRTESRDDVFFAMFEPAATADWWGNLKKLKLDKVDGKLTFVDANDHIAMSSDGAIKDTTKTFWSLTTDGGKVAAGGVGELLKARDLTTRKILTNTGTNGALQAFNSTNINKTAYGLSTDADLWSLWQVNSATDLGYSISYGWGYDTQDLNNNNSKSDTRGWIMADILHSMPLTINYGARTGFSKADPDLRLIVGTNDGLLHSFRNDNGKEEWAFFPKELGAVLTKRRKNTVSAGVNVYGVDGTPVSYIIDANKDGTINASDGDKAYLYFGLRRGGQQIYALDVTDPDNPTFLWAIAPSVTGFSELGQTWSTPIVTKIPGYYSTDGNGKKTRKPVLIFGGGYDPVKDNHATLATPSADTMGRGIFIVDALTGAKVWSVTPAANSAKNMQLTGLVHSFPAEVAVLDSNGDSLTDRIYAGDSGGNLWRIDMPGDTLPDSSQKTWSILKLFETVKSTDTRTKRTDRRFFNKPNIVKTEFSGRAVDVITLGTGDRTNPISKDNLNDVNDPTVDEQFYMIRDQRTTLYRAALDNDDCSKTPKADFRCYLPLSPADLYDITDNKIQTGTADEKTAAIKALNDAQGWRLDLTGNGEKNLSKARTLGGKVEFNTFTPDSETRQVCGVTAGTARNYLVDLFNGTPAQDCDGDGTKDDHACIIGDGIRELSTLIVKEGDIFKTQAPSDEPGEIEPCLPCDTGEKMNGPYGNYWEREDL